MKDKSFNSTLILGIGNTLLSDEGVGVHVIRAIAKDLAESLNEHDHIQIIDGGTLSFTLLADVQSHDNLIAIDAAQLKAAPGEMKCFAGPEMDRYLRSGRKSVHEVGLSDLLDMARLSNHLPKNRALIGIQPASTDWGEQLTHMVAAAVPKAVTQAYGLLKQWDAFNGHPPTETHSYENDRNVCY